jgi:Photosynthetic reaction centre cytochrome C subunit
MMKSRLKGPAIALAPMAFVCLMAIALVSSAAAQNQSPGQSQAAAQARAATAKGQTAGEFFKNVTTSTLKGLSPSDFLGAMGVMTAAVGYDCSNCHSGAGTDTFDWVTDSIPQKKTARKMVEMVAAINRQNFGGAQMVTCWTCHHGLDLPTTSIALDKLYGEPNDEKRDVVLAGQGEPPATQILDQYIQAMGGAQKLAGVKSFIASGHSEGYGGLGGNGAFQIFAQAPDHRGMWINFPDHPDRGTSAWTYDGKTGWVSSPRGLLGQYELTGNDLAGAKLDSVLAFPGQIKTAFPNWRVGPEDVLNSRDVYVVQGSVPGGMLAALPFSKTSTTIGK